MRASDIRRTALITAAECKKIEDEKASTLALAKAAKAAKAAEAKAMAKSHNDPAESAPMPKMKKRKSKVPDDAAGKKLKVSSHDDAAGALPSELPFAADMADHAETPLDAYKDIAPILSGLAASLGKKPAALRAWDPFYCTGAAAQRLATVGFPNSHHRCEDFHALVASGTTPEHDILVTNPPYSADHLERLFAHCVRSNKPWALLLPWFVVKKPWFKTYAAKHTVHFLAPRRRYYFLPPSSMVDEGRDKVTAPFETFWYLCLGSEAQQRSLADWWNAEHGEGGNGRCRLGVGFKKRRGTPGFNTLLDEDGLLIGRPVPEGWNRSKK